MQIERYLAPIEKDNPCGKDIEYDVSFLKLSKSIEETPNKQFGKITIFSKEPNWAKIEESTKKLLSISKDLRLFIILVKSWTKKNGIKGYSRGILLILKILELYWDSLYPKILFNEEKKDFFIRVNTLKELGDNGSLYKIFVHTALFELQGEKVTLLDFKKNQKKYEIQKEYFEKVKKYVLKNKKYLEEAIQSIEKIKIFIEKNTGLTEILNINKTKEYLNFLQNFKIYKNFQKKTDLIEKEEKKNLEEITCRKEVLFLLKKIQDYFIKFEPSHPGIFLIKKIEFLMEKDFMQIIGFLAPSSITVFENILGKTNEILEKK